ncbi:olfactory receptor 5V1-like [Spea bombifrons]|uniref:olfactory receptor 5V1-like n=1 Tax=Spea bombifrons TaxID=233779 RepID=UPI00234991D4|nr:olfactory receptor 5V1-like [Spea bombifrons]
MMQMKNITLAEDFYLLGIVTAPALQKLLFMLFACIYIMTILGNFMVIVIIIVDFHLHTPMYFFLVNLALIEILYTTAITPNNLKNLLQEDKTISFVGCFIQMFIFVTLGGSECVLLGTMAYDRYVAICYPLQYNTIMDQSLCIHLTLTCWTIGLMNSLVHTILTSMLTFCHNHLLRHYFCEIPPLLKISCTDTHINELIVFLVGGSVIVGSLVLTVISYVYIIAAVIKIPGQGKRKTFSTCSSHLIVVVTFFGTVIFTYLRPASHSFYNEDHVISLVYSVVTPLLNPIIYSFRNKDFQRAMQKILISKLVI